jgi:hypothetical protein
MSRRADETIDLLTGQRPKRIAVEKLTSPLKPTIAWVAKPDPNRIKPTLLEARLQEPLQEQLTDKTIDMAPVVWVRESKLLHSDGTTSPTAFPMIEFSNQRDRSGAMDCDCTRDSISVLVKDRLNDEQLEANRPNGKRG